jgi:hypothetical protein
VLHNFVVAKSCFVLTSDHSPVLITFTADAQNKKKQPSPSNKHTNVDDFRCLVNEKLTLNVSLKTEDDIVAAVKLFNDMIRYNGQAG